MSKINVMIQERGELHSQMRALNDAALSSGADLSGDDLGKYNRLEARFDELTSLINRAQKDEERERSIVAAAPAKLVVAGSEEGRTRNDGLYNALNAPAYGDAFWAQIRRGREGVGPDIRAALQVGTNSEGGFIVPTAFDARLVKALEDFNEFRSLCSVINTSSLHKIPVESSLGAATWAAEEGNYGESDTAFSQVSLDAFKLTRIIKVSEELLSDAFFDVESYIANAFGRSFGAAEEAAFVNGDGSGKPTGFVAGGQVGKTTATNAAITADEIMDLYYSLKRAYRGRAVWVMNDATIKVVRKLKDSTNQYLWQPGLQASEPDTLMGRPVVSSTAMPTIATTAKVAVFGDLSYYTIADRAGRQAQRLSELYAATGQVGFRMNERVDGKVTLAEAIKVLEMAV